MQYVPKHRVFISFHHDDQYYKDLFVGLMENDIVDNSVEDGDIDDNVATETIRQNIRDKFIRDATVTVVLLGPCTWQRKHVDWEIGSSLRDTRRNSRCGLLGILLPSHVDYVKPSYRSRFLSPRLADNCGGDNPYACIYDWPSHSNAVRTWVHRAFERRAGTARITGERSSVTTGAVHVPRAGQASVLEQK